MRFFVVCPGGLEIPLAQELAEIATRPDSKALGAWVIDPTPTSPTGGIGLSGPLSAATALNLHSRIASRVLLQMAQASYRQEDDLYKLASGLAWEDWFSSNQTLRVDVTAHRSPLKSRRQESKPFPWDHLHHCQEEFGGLPAEVLKRSCSRPDMHRALKPQALQAKNLFAAYSSYGYFPNGIVIVEIMAYPSTRFCAQNSLYARRLI